MALNVLTETKAASYNIKLKFIEHSTIVWFQNVFKLSIQDVYFAKLDN